MVRFLLVVLLGLAWLLSGCDPTSSGEFVSDTYVHQRSRWSPTGEQIAFTGRVNGVYGIQLVDTAGATIRRILDGEGIGVDWSPDGLWLTFSRYGSIFKIKATGDSLTQLTTSTNDIRPSWSPDGKFIAFMRTGIWVLNLDSASVRQIYPGGNFPFWHTNGRDVVVMETDIHPQTGGAIAYSFRRVSPISDSTQLLFAFVIRSDAGFPSMNATGSVLAFGAKAVNQYVQIWTRDIAPGTHTQLTIDGGDNPSWSPDGRSIVYTRTQRGDGGLWIMNGDGTQKRRLTSPD